MGINNVLESAIGKDEAGGLQVQGLLWLQSEFQASLRRGEALGVPWCAQGCGSDPQVLLGLSCISDFTPSAVKKHTNPKTVTV